MTTQRQAHRRTPSPAGHGRSTQVVVSPDRRFSARWSGRTAIGNCRVYAGPDCRGRPLRVVTLVRADTPEEASRQAALLGARAEPAPLAAHGSTGPLAEVLYVCSLPADDLSPAAHAGWSVPR